jgi:GTP-binding protein
MVAAITGMSRFVDEVDITVRSGKGGPGAVSFRRERYVPRGGPDGGDGGKGGDVLIRVRSNLKTLYHLTLTGSISAGNGLPGRGRKQNGADGEDSVVYVPPGTVIMDSYTGETLADLTENGDSFIAVRGGRGGRGNARFATSRNRAPRHAQKGEAGRGRELSLQIKVISDVGLVGLPNAGKSTLLSVLTNARPRIAGYPFTTLTPNLGVMRYGNDLEYLIADIPGLIQGASEGHGLGIRFLKHIERTRVLLFLIDLCAGAYEPSCHTLLGELSGYSERLLEKPRLMVGTKCDAVDDGAALEFLSSDIEGEKVVISSIARTGLEELKQGILVLMGELDE